LVKMAFTRTAGLRHGASVRKRDEYLANLGAADSHGGICGQSAEFAQQIWWRCRALKAGENPEFLRKSGHV